MLKMKLQTSGFTFVLTLIICVLMISSCSVLSSTNAKSLSTDGEISQSYIKPTLSDGYFYLNGNTENCYFKIQNKNIQFIIGDRNQMQKLFDTTSENLNNSNGFKFEEWNEQIISNWNTSKSYDIIYEEILNSTYIAWDITYDSNGDIVRYSFADYVDENNFDYNKCRFTRVSADNIS